MLFQVSIALSSDWYEPADSSNSADVEAALRVTDFRLGWFAEPIYVTGDYPERMKNQVERESSGMLDSRLPELQPNEMNLIRGNFL